MLELSSLRGDFQSEQSNKAELGQKLAVLVEQSEQKDQEIEQLNQKYIQTVSELTR